MDSTDIGTAGSPEASSGTFDDDRHCARHRDAEAAAAHALALANLDVAAAA